MEEVLITTAGRSYFRMLFAGVVATFVSVSVAWAGEARQLFETRVDLCCGAKVLVDIEELRSDDRATYIALLPVRANRVKVQDTLTFTANRVVSIDSCTFGVIEVFSDSGVITTVDICTVEPTFDTIGVYHSRHSGELWLSNYHELRFALRYSAVGGRFYDDFAESGVLEVRRLDDSGGLELLFATDVGHGTALTNDQTQFMFETYDTSVVGMPRSYLTIYDLIGDSSYVIEDLNSDIFFPIRNTRADPLFFMKHVGTSSSMVDFRKEVWRVLPCGDQERLLTEPSSADISFLFVGDSLQVTVRNEATSDFKVRYY